MEPKTFDYNNSLIFQNTIGTGRTMNQINKQKTMDNT